MVVFAMLGLNLLRALIQKNSGQNIVALIRVAECTIHRDVNIANTIRLPNVVLKLGQRCSRWSNINTILVQ